MKAKNKIVKMAVEIIEKSNIKVPVKSKAPKSCSGCCGSCGGQ